jgi:hypothetical protein
MFPNRALVSRKTARKKTPFLALALAMSLGHTACGADNRMVDSTPLEPPTKVTSDQEAGMKITIKVEDKVVTATLIDSKTTRDFVSLLPLTLTMNDLFKREKFAHFPRAISEEGERTHSYEVGDLIYWSPGPDVAIFYRHDGQAIPNPGIIVIGKIDSGIEAFNVPGSVKVTVELAR